MFSEVKKNPPKRKINQLYNTENPKSHLNHRIESAEISEESNRHMVDPSLSSSESYDFKHNDKLIPEIEWNSIYEKKISKIKRYHMSKVKQKSEVLMLKKQ